MIEDDGMKIAVASGKGGTGKTTVATNLALSIGNCQLLDCDVEEPDSHLFLEMELSKAAEVSLQVPVIDLDKCTLCGECSRFCQYNALAVLAEKVMVFPDLCHGCGGCTMVCPAGAITEKDRSIGVLEKGTAQGIELYHGLLNIGEPMATPIITALKKMASRDKHVILDSPPGAACPAIESIRDADYCILVTEPTPFGLHDLKIAVQVVRGLGVPFGVAINKDGAGFEVLYDYCKGEAIPIIFRIPDSRKIAELYSRGRPFTLEMPEWKEKFIELFNSISQAVGG